MGWRIGCCIARGEVSVCLLVAFVCSRDVEVEVDMESISDVSIGARMEDLFDRVEALLEDGMTIRLSSVMPLEPYGFVVV